MRRSSTYSSWSSCATSNRQPPPPTYTQGEQTGARKERATAGARPCCCGLQVRCSHLEVQDDLGAAAQLLALGVARDGEGAAGLALPNVLLVVVVLGHHRHLVRHQVGRVEAHAELANHAHVGARRQGLHKGLGARPVCHRPRQEEGQTRVSPRLRQQQQGTHRGAPARPSPAWRRSAHLAMVPRLLTRSALVMPMPESMMVSVLLDLLGMILYGGRWRRGTSQILNTQIVSRRRAPERPELARWQQRRCAGAPGRRAPDVELRVGVQNALVREAHEPAHSRRTRQRAGRGVVTSLSQQQHELCARDAVVLHAARCWPVRRVEAPRDARHPRAGGSLQKRVSGGEHWWSCDAVAQAVAVGCSSSAALPALRGTSQTKMRSPAVGRLRTAAHLILSSASLALLISSCARRPRRAARSV